MGAWMGGGLGWVCGWLNGVPPGGERRLRVGGRGCGGMAAAGGMAGCGAAGAKQG